MCRVGEELGEKEKEKVMGEDAQAEEKKERVRMEEPGGGGAAVGCCGGGRSQGGAAGLGGTLLRVWNTGASCRADTLSHVIAR